MFHEVLQSPLQGQVGQTGYFSPGTLAAQSPRAVVKTRHVLAVSTIGVMQTISVSAEPIFKTDCAN